MQEPICLFFWQTYEGLRITVFSVIEAVESLLISGMNCVLTERFCQDSVEEYFGRQRQSGHRCDIPSLQAFGYNDNAIRIQRQVSVSADSTRERYKEQKSSWVNITDALLKKGSRNAKEIEVIWSSSEVNR